MTVEELKAIVAEQSRIAKERFAERWGADDVKAVITSVVRNADKVKWTEGRAA